MYLPGTRSLRSQGIVLVFFIAAAESPVCPISTSQASCQHQGSLRLFPAFGDLWNSPSLNPRFFVAPASDLVQFHQKLGRALSNCRAIATYDPLADLTVGGLLTKSQQAAEYAQPFLDQMEN